MKKFIVPFFIIIISLPAAAQPVLQNLLTENLDNPVGLDVAQPRFNWAIISGRRNTMQTAYEIKVTSGNENVWGSGKVMSDSSVHVVYKGKALQSNKRYSWKVRIWDNEGKSSAWSKPAFFQTAFFSTNDWKAKWIEPGYAEDDKMRPAAMFRKQFIADKKIISAMAYITAHGMYEAQINGKRVGDAYFTPGWTSYNKRLQYEIFDVTSLLNQGQNAIGATIGNGWYRGYLAWHDNKNIYGKNTGLLFQLEIKYADGSADKIISDGSWKSSTGSILYAEIYNGETIDARLAKAGWALPGYDDSKWSNVRVADYPMNNLIVEYNEPVKKQETFRPAKIFTTPKGEKVIDFGQNLTGWVVFKVKGRAGDTVTIKHAEVLDKEGNFYTENLRAAKATDTYILKGGSEETFEPHFTFHGFRYIQVIGYPGKLNADDFTAVALYSDMKKTGTFVSSNALINQLQHNIQWGQRGNFLDVPTDCPQRDERLGWTGDAQVFSRTATFNMGVNNFFAKWLKDVAADQEPSGSVPFVIPNVLGPGAAGSTGWADVATIVPWNMYLAYGDKKILADQYASMKAWVEYMHAKSKNDLWDTGFHFGDWLFYRPDDDNSGWSAVTDRYLIAQCFYAHSVQLLINAAKVLGNTTDVSDYQPLLQRIKAAFMKEYVTPSGRLVSGTQTAYTLALYFDMLPENLRVQAAARLAENVKDYDDHITTGFLGSSYISHVLSRYGYTSLAYKLLMQDTYPSWLYPVKMGATTIWERWDGIKPDSSFETPGMNSFNHYAYGAIGDWMYRVVAGLDTYEDAPGYKHIKIFPHSDSSLTMAAAELQTYYGKVSSNWKTDASGFTLDVDVPANTTATVYLPAASTDDITESGRPLITEKEIEISGTHDSYTEIRIGSGTYHFAVKK
ncbi:MAG: family 78 glycoside hydrolase catalytic domain [Bacteroidetes bacterium]|nr:family 78 glycoside hydrolase catalytic domain [Bacteroidota bacterium]